MIIDARQLNESADVRGDIAIIGGGAAGITLALELAEKFKDVLVFESGATSSEMETQSLYNGKLLGHKQPSLQTSRLRFLGGSTNHWVGRCAPQGRTGQPTLGRMLRFYLLRPNGDASYTTPKSTYNDTTSFNATGIRMNLETKISEINICDVWVVRSID